MTKPLFVMTSEGYVINLALVRWIKIDKAGDEVRFNFQDSETGADWIDVSLEEGHNIIGKMAYLMLE